jgi:simple sugar transport system ATP-binding protein
VTQPLARLSGVSKRFGAVRALREASLELLPGEVHGVLGENGAGKSTLVGVLGGMVRPDAGVVEVGGRVVDLATPRDAGEAGVGMVHQHFALVPALTVLENLALGLTPWTRGWRRPEAALRGEVEALLERTGLRIPLDDPLEGLGVGSRQRVEILKALLRRPRVLVMDEPTSVLAPQEVASLFAFLRDRAAEGIAVALVGHKLDEVLSVAHRVTVLRQGRTVLRAPSAQLDAPALVRAMVGEGREDPVALGHRVPLGAGTKGGGEVVAALRDVRVPGPRGAWALDGVSLEVRRGEVVGIAGVEGNGQRELALVLAGVQVPHSGTARLSNGVGFIPQDRSREGLIAEFDLTANTALALRRDPASVRGPLLRWGAIEARAAELMRRFDVRAPGPRARAGALSGGNQQRMVVARELSMATDLLVAENPTRGLDVGAAAFTHAELERLATDPRGPGTVLLSTDLDEVLALSQRVLVMVDGALVPVPEGERTREGVGARMLARRVVHG